MRAFVVVAASALALTGCVPGFISENEHTLFMEIANIQGISASQDDGDVLFSDVSDGFNDDAAVTVNIFRKNPTVTSTSPLEHVHLVRYEVRYFRTDGRDTEGVDVPFRITGPLNDRLHTPTGTGEVEVTVNIPIVRHQAKQEPPLRNLLGILTENDTLELPGAGIITAIAEITIHGRSLSGKGLSATGRLQVTFADFADE